MELTERLSAAQRLYLAGQKSLERAEELREATNGGGALERKLDALLTPEMLARSRPPQRFCLERSGEIHAPPRIRVGHDLALPPQVLACLCEAAIMQSPVRKSFVHVRPEQEVHAL